MHIPTHESAFKVVVVAVCEVVGKRNLFILALEKAAGPAPHAAISTKSVHWVCQRVMSRARSCVSRRLACVFWREKMC